MRIRLSQLRRIIRETVEEVVQEKELDELELDEYGETDEEGRRAGEDESPEYRGKGQQNDYSPSKKDDGAFGDRY